MLFIKTSKISKKSVNMIPFQLFLLTTSLKKTLKGFLKILFYNISTWPINFE